MKIFIAVFNTVIAVFVTVIVFFFTSTFSSSVDVIYSLEVNSSSSKTAPSSGTNSLSELLLKSLSEISLANYHP